MTVDIGSALGNGFQRTFKQNGLMLAALLFALNIVNNVFSGSFFAELFPSAAVDEALPVLFTLPPAASGIGLLVTVLASVIVTIAAVRTLVGDETQVIPSAYFRHNLGLAVVNILVGGIVFGIIVGFGLILLIVPGLFLLTALFFWNFYVIIEDQNFIQGLRNSWELTQGNRLRLFILGALTLILTGVINVVVTLPITVVFGETSFISIVLQQVPNAVMSVFYLATAAQAFNQLQ